MRWTLLQPCRAISIHAAREGGDITPYVAGIVTCISIHAAREGGDGVRVAAEALRVISIHAAREGGDCAV